MKKINTREKSPVFKLELDISISPGSPQIHNINPKDLVIMNKKGEEETSQFAKIIIWIILFFVLLGAVFSIIRYFGF